MNLYQKLSKIREMVEVIKKNRSGYGYKYTDISEILARVTAGLKKYGVSLIPRVIPDTFQATPLHYTKTKVLKTGEAIEEKVNEFLTSAQMLFTWVDNESPEDTIEVRWAITGCQSDPGQSFGSALTYGTRYFLQSYFQIASPEDDIDSWKKKQKEAEEAENNEVVKQIISQIHEIVTKFVAEDQENRQIVADITKKYARDRAGKASANYMLIDNPLMASGLLKELSGIVSNKEKDAAKETSTKSGNQKKKVQEENIKEEE